MPADRVCERSLFAAAPAASPTDRKFNGPNEVRGERGQREAWAADHGAADLARAQPERSRAQCSDVGGGRGDVEMGGSERPRGRTCSDRLEAGDSVVEVGGQRRVEYQLWDRLGLGRIEGRGRVEEEVSFRLSKPMSRHRSTRRHSQKPVKSKVFFSSAKRLD